MGNREDTKIVLVGHSIGCYMVLDILERNPMLIKHTIHVELLMPFMFWDNLTFIHKMRLEFLRNTGQSFTKWYLFKLINHLNGLSQHQLYNLINKAENLDEESCRALGQRFFTQRLFSNFVKMGFDEIYEISSTKNTDYVMSILKRLTGLINMHCVYTNDDDWAPLQDLIYLEDNLTFMKSCFLPDVTHGFSTIIESSDAMNDILETQITHSLESIFDPKPTPLLSKL